MDAAPSQGPGSLPTRFGQVVFSPGRLFQTLRGDPRWFGTLLAGAVLVALALILVPGDIWVQSMREEAAARGTEIPEFMASAGPLFRLASALSATVFYFLWAFFLAAILTVFFAFLFGDEAGYKQYLSVVAHGLLITAMGSLLLLPLRILQHDPQVTLNLGTFFFFLDGGYLSRVLGLLDLFGIWSYMVMAVGVAEMDPRRGMTLPVGFFLAFALAFALLVGLIPR